MNISAIETHYDGRHFRSRLEARWAVYFNALGVRYEYEPETFDLGEYGWYLPDFYLPQLNMYAEVKPDIGYLPDCGMDVGKLHNIDGDAWNKVVSFSETYPIILIFGQSFAKPSRILGWRGYPEEVMLDLDGGEIDLWVCGGDEDWTDVDPYKTARKKAMSERFNAHP